MEVTILDSHKTSSPAQEQKQTPKEESIIYLPYTHKPQTLRAMSIFGNVVPTSSLANLAKAIKERFEKDKKDKDKEDNKKDGEN